MIRLPTTLYVATTPIDARWSFDRLAGVVRAQLGLDPRGDAAFIFHNRARTLLKILWRDERGVILLYRRLDRGTYRIPEAIPHDARHVTVSARELALIFEGVDEALLRAARRAVGPRR
jgi:transposase